MKTGGQPLPDLPGSRGQRVARCQNTPCMSALRSGLGEEELALLTLSGAGEESGRFVTDGAHRGRERKWTRRRAAGLGRRETEGKNNQRQLRFTGP